MYIMLDLARSIRWNLHYLVFLFFPLAVTFTFTLPIFTVLISKSLVYRVAIAGEELARTPRIGVAMHVSLLGRQ